MSNKLKAFLISLLVFIISYLVLCFLIPTFRIKLEAEPIVYFIESIKHNPLIKAIISFILSLLSAIVILLTVSNPNKK